VPNLHARRPRANGASGAKLGQQLLLGLVQLPLRLRYLFLNRLRGWRRRALQLSLAISHGWLLHALTSWARSHSRKASTAISRRLSILMLRSSPAAFEA
jgi:hypothetical protein